MINYSYHEHFNPGYQLTQQELAHSSPGPLQPQTTYAPLGQHSVINYNMIQFSCGLVSTNLDSGDFASPSAAERCRQDLARRDCLALGIISGDQEVSSHPGGEGSRPFGIGGRLGKGVQGEMRSGLRGRWGQEDGRVCIERCISHVVCGLSESRAWHGYGSDPRIMCLSANIFDPRIIRIM